jgi:hypothetical protein
MSRFAVIVALGALLSMFGRVVTASPALAGGRGPKWQPFPQGPITLDGFCRFKVRGDTPVNKAFIKILKMSDQRQ